MCALKYVCIERREPRGILPTLHLIRGGEGDQKWRRKLGRSDAGEEEGGKKAEGREEEEESIMFTKTTMENLFFFFCE